jgi:hypothetical protein
MGMNMVCLDHLGKKPTFYAYLAYLDNWIGVGLNLNISKSQIKTMIVFHMYIDFSDYRIMEHYQPIICFKL